MPELPEVEALARFLAQQAADQTVERVELHSLSALKTFEPPIDELVGRAFTGAARRGKYLALDFDGLWLALHLSRAGWVRWRDDIRTLKPGPKKGPLALRVRMSGGGGFDATEAGKEKRLSIHVAHALAQVPGIARLGPDPLSADFDEAALRAALADAGNGQLKAALTHQGSMSGVGNAYSDEILHAAGLSPFKSAGKLNADELTRLFQALKEILTEAVVRSSGMQAAELKSDKKSHMRVHGRSDQPCPTCGDTVRTVSFSTSSLQYCPTCQTGGKTLADRRLSRLLK